MVSIVRLAEGEQNEWLDFVSGVFVNTGREYFRNHLENDPFADISKILVARDDVTHAIGSSP